MPDPFFPWEGPANYSVSRLRSDAATETKGGRVWQRTTASVSERLAGAAGTVRTPESHGYGIAPRFRSIAAYRRSNLGESWQPSGIKGKMAAAFAIGIRVKADDPSVLRRGETTTGEKGKCSAPQTSGRLGRSCHSLPSSMLPCGALSRIPLTPTHCGVQTVGEVYVSEDAGASWRRIAREFGKIRATVWVPNWSCSPGRSMRRVASPRAGLDPRVHEWPDQARPGR